ncbi:hypothetical protein Ahy_A06g027514 [Arachis hypogaea]|uniref:Uncharacterized protein n=1 Tax=Arachis hypogaea TaxID=3818 RepID=A0A445CNX5_ARAHY|nr:hypothetical protein Ahy_A06g027514 [Arachis hypogaea]
MPELLGLDAPVPVAVDAGSEGKVTCADAQKLRDPNPSLNIRFTNSRSGKDSSGWKQKRSEEWVAVGRRRGPDARTQKPFPFFPSPTPTTPSTLLSNWHSHRDTQNCAVRQHPIAISPPSRRKSETALEGMPSATTVQQRGHCPLALATTFAHCCHHGFLHRRSNHRRRSNLRLDVYPSRSTASPSQRPGFFFFPS